VKLENAHRVCAIIESLQKETAEFVSSYLNMETECQTCSWWKKCCWVSQTEQAGDKVLEW